MAVTGITDKNDQIVLGIIGDPRKQVKSPATFGEYFRLHGINAVMVPLHVESDDFERVLEGLRGVKNFGGAVVTIPHKYETYKMAFKKGPIHPSVPRSQALTGPNIAFRKLD